MSIPTIEIEEVSVQEVYVPNWIQQQPTVDYLVPPVILNPTIMTDPSGCS